tara:strand:+ start:779 stop:1678 length:900 start_codon:yes stop_codon:yes gene_type:complete
MNKKNFLTILLRIRNENLFLESFIKHYFAEGVDEIHILDDNSTQPLPDIVNDPRVFVYEATHFKSHHEKLIDAQLLYSHLLKDKTEWFMFIDADEFITTRRNSEKTIREELETTFKDADLIKIPWVMFGSNGQDKNPKQVLTETTWRWDHNLKHPHPKEALKIWKHRCCKYDKIEVKSIFKTKAFNKLTTHCPSDPLYNINIVDSIDNIPNYANVDETEIWYYNLREECINRAYLTCNHYRNISKEQMEQKSNDSHLPLYRVSNCYELQLASDFSDIEDTFLKEKAIKRGYYENTSSNI